MSARISLNNPAGTSGNASSARPEASTLGDRWRTRVPYSNQSLHLLGQMKQSCSVAQTMDVGFKRIGSQSPNVTEKLASKHALQFENVCIPEMITNKPIDTLTYAAYHTFKTYFLHNIKPSCTRS